MGGTSRSSDLTLGKIFMELQGNKEALGITDYSIMQPTLEQVFIRFAREQEANEDDPESAQASRPVDEGPRARWLPSCFTPSSSRICEASAKRSDGPGFKIERQRWF